MGFLSMNVGNDFLGFDIKIINNVTARHTFDSSTWEADTGKVSSRIDKSIKKENPVSQKNKQKQCH